MRLTCEYQTPIVRHQKGIMDSFLKSMEKFEDQDAKSDNDYFEDEPSQGMVKEEVGHSEAMMAKDTMFRKVKQFSIVVPTNISMKKLSKIIHAHVKNMKNQDTNEQSSMFANTFQSRLKMKEFGVNPKKYLSSMKMMQMFDGSLGRVSAEKLREIRRFDLGEEVQEEDDSDDEEVVEKKPEKDNITVKLLSQEGEVDTNETVEQWIKRRIKEHNPPRSYLKIFKREVYKAPNTISFTIQEGENNEELKEEFEEEEINQDSSKSSRGKRAKSKTNRTYSLYIQKEKQQKSLQERELERIITKDIVAKDSIKEELGDSSKLFELIKLLYMLKDSNIRSLFESKAKNSIISDLSGFSMNKQKFKNLFTNSKIDSLLRKYLLTRHQTECVSSKDEALVEFVQHFPMVYEFKTRILFFKITAFSSMRNKYYASELFTRAITRDEGGISISRRKLEVPREVILEDALDKAKDLQMDDSFLEFQFENEVGTGLGPTLEYYALISKAIKEEPTMWRETTDNSLYPNPLNMKKRSSKEKKKIEKFFELVGTIIARSLMDERLVDLPVSVVFWKLVFSETAILDDVEKIDKPFHKGLKMIQDLVDQQDRIQKDPMLPGHIKEAYNKYGYDEENEEDEDDFSENNMNPKNQRFADWECDYERPIEPDLNVEDL